MTKKRKEVIKKNLFSVGEMAQLFHINIRTLRYYDEIGILKPEYVNKDTNYRYYSTKQFERLNTIKYLRALDVSLEHISNFLEEKDVNVMLSIFIEQRKEVIRKQQQLLQIERKITNRIQQIEAAMTNTLGNVVIKHLPQRKIAALERRFSPSDDLEPLIRDLSKEHYLDDAIFLGNVGVSIHQNDLIERQFSYLSSVFIVVETEDEYNSTATVLPEGLYATVQYQGTHKDSKPYYTLLLNYLLDFGYKIKGDSVEITIIDSGLTKDPEKYVTEIQIPFQSSNDQ